MDIYKWCVVDISLLHRRRRAVLFTILWLNFLMYVGVIVIMKGDTAMIHVYLDP